MSLHRVFLVLSIGLGCNSTPTTCRTEVDVSLQLVENRPSSVNCIKLVKCAVYLPPQRDNLEKYNRPKQVHTQACAYRSKPSLILSAPWFWDGVGVVQLDRSWRQWRILKAKGPALALLSHLPHYHHTHLLTSKQPPMLGMQGLRLLLFFFFFCAFTFEYVLQTRPTTGCFKTVHGLVGLSYDHGSF